LGPNGAGKSTLLSVIAGLIRPTGGSVWFAGRAASDIDAATLATAGLCRIPEGHGVFANLTVAEHLWLLACRGRDRRSVEDRAFALFPRLADRRSQLAGSLSGGEQQMLALCRALVTDPTILLIDELSMGLAPIVVADLYERVAELAGGGTTIVLVEQFVHTISELATRGIALVAGRIVLDGPVSEITPHLRAAYFATPEEPLR
ncbi:MAG: ATP-binding cassette domain-containing protein, partial [Actinobacteria bacterium]|nr:ATP-binding cassette domain-containing protein [Actinomycetota bacterium]